MSFSVISGAPTFGTQMPTSVGFTHSPDLSVLPTRLYDDEFYKLGSLQVLLTGAVNISGLNQPLNGFLTYSANPTRPVSGQVYPRNDS